jgi:hypothetical protein
MPVDPSAGLLQRRSLDFEQMGRITTDLYEPGNGNIYNKPEDDDGGY